MRGESGITRPPTDRPGGTPMTGSIRAHQPHRGTTGALSRVCDRPQRSRHAPADPSRIQARHGTRRAIATAAVLALAVFAVGLLDAAGFDHRVAAASIAVLAGDLFTSWFLIARANRGSSQRPTRRAHPADPPQQA
jgi:hypothetical protein